MTSDSRPIVRVFSVAVSVLVAASAAFAQAKIDYKTVAEARRAVPSLPGAVVSEKLGWLVVEDGANKSIWSFAPSNHEANPAVVKRVVTQTPGGVDLSMAILCEASKAACDRLYATFLQMNEDMKRQMRSR
jgi:hypothetical protein